MNRLVRIALKSIAVGLGLGVLAFFLWRDADRFNPFETIQSHEILLLALPIVLYVLALTVGGLNWYVLLSGLGKTPPKTTVILIILITQIGKYLPGNIWHFAGRMVMVRKFGIGTLESVTSVIFELIITLCTVAVIFAAYLATGENLLLLPEEYRFPVAILVGIAVIVIFIILPFVRHFDIKFQFVAKHLARLSKNIPSHRTIVIFTALQLIIFFILGLCFKIVIGLVADFNSLSMFDAVALFSFAWVVGMAIPGAPGGIGIREAAIVLGLGSIIGAGEAALVAILLRLVTVSGDGLAFVIGTLLFRREDTAAIEKN